MLQIIGIVAVIALVATLLVRPASIVAMVLAVGVVGAAIVVSWNDVEQVRAQHAANAAFQQERAAASANVTVPPANPAHAGS